MTQTVTISGGFDPIHIGHIRMIREAANYGEVTVILNSDEWLTRKKNYVFSPWEQRAEILRALECVAKVVPVDDSDGSVCEALNRIDPDYFANGGDRIYSNTPETELCEKLGIKMLWNIGGGKVTSSQWMVDAVR